MNLEFMPSDVYLFAKVLWMNLKNDNVGFRGRYNRGDVQIYLDKNKYNVCTLEPIHELLEQATCDDMNERITINECIDYMLLQLKIFKEPQFLLPESLENQQYAEETKRIVEKTNPDEYGYSDKAKIHEMQKMVINKANVFVEDVRSSSKKEIKITHCTMLQDGTFQFLAYLNGRKMNEYLVNVKKMIYNIKNETIILELDDFVIEKFGYTSYDKNGIISFKEYFSKSEQIIILKPQSV